MSTPTKDGSTAPQAPSGIRIRPVAQVVVPLATSDGAGVKLKRSIATRTLDYVDPFLLFDHFGSDNPDDYIAGFPMHPHRGIETVTYMLAGAVAHRDSIGNSGRIEAGDVQWMTAGRGILHEEMPERIEKRMEGFQLWVNLPARMKMSAPRYQEFNSTQIPRVVRPDGTEIRVIAGTVDSVSGPVMEIAANPVYLDVLVKRGGIFQQPVELGHAAFAYVFDGQGWFGPTDRDLGAIVPHPRLVVFGDGDMVSVLAPDEPVRFLLVSGQPLGEPIARHGPFVMNTAEEIEQTLQELANGTFISGRPG